MEPIELINLTPHQITLYKGPEVVAMIPPVCGEDGKPTPARVDSIAGPAEDVEGLPVPVAAPYTYGAVVGLPTLKEMRANPGRRYIVSFMVASAVVAENEGMRIAGHGRAEYLLCPDTDKHAVRAPKVKDSETGRETGGQVIGTTRLVRAV